DSDGRAVQSKAIVDHTGSGACGGDAKDADLAGGDMKFERGDRRGRIESGKTWLLDVARGVHHFDGGLVAGKAHGAAARLAEEPELEISVGALFKSDAR